jgi:hypothetical protein
MGEPCRLVASPLLGRRAKFALLTKPARPPTKGRAGFFSSLQSLETAYTIKNTYFLALFQKTDLCKKKQ